MSLADKLHITEFDSLEEFLDDLGVEEVSDWGEAVDKIEEEYPDFAVYTDVNLSAHLDDLEYNGFSEEEIITRNEAMYGHVIDFYYIKDDMYIMMYGVR